MRRLIGVGALLAAALVVIAAIRSQSSPPKPSVPGLAHVGVNVNRLFDDLTYRAPRVRALLHSLASTGADTARSDTLWELTEPSRGTLNWSFDDGVAGALAAAGLQWLPIVDYAPAWARPAARLLHSPPDDPADYAAFVTAFARRYGSAGSFWAEHPELPARPVRTYEIWNEPDTPLFWSPAPSAAAYARLYAAARAAIHAVDPTAMVLVGGLTRPVGFLPELLAADPALRGGLDGVAIHPYGDSTTAVLDLVRRARDTLRSLGLGRVPLYLTEFGWVTSPPGAHHYIPAADRPALVQRTVAALGHTDCGLAGEVIYTWVTPRANPADPEDWYGLEPPGGGPSADAHALAQGTAQARAPGARAPVCG